MRRKMVLLLLLVFMAFGTAACSDNNSQQAGTTNIEQQEEKVKKIDKNIDAVAEELGLSEKSDAFYSMIGAIDGKKYNEHNAELYQFDTDSDAYKQIIGSNSVLNVSAYKDGIILVFPIGTEPDAELIEKFNKIRFK